MRTFVALALAAAFSFIGASAMARGANGHPPSPGQSKAASGSHSNGHAGAKSESKRVQKADHDSAGAKSNKHAQVSPGGPRAGTGVKRDADGKIHRSAAAKDKFEKSHPCPSTGKTNGACPGYVIDHIRPLKQGGADSPSNMQWQTTADARTKDRTERTMCQKR